MFFDGEDFGVDDVGGYFLEECDDDICYELDVWCYEC